MIEQIKRIFHRLTPMELASRELVEAELEKLQAESTQEWAAAVVTYNTARISRLRLFLSHGESK